MATRVLLLGGHGKVSLLMTPLLVSRSWHLTSVIRNPDQKPAILEAGKNGPGKVEVLIASLEDVKSEADAQKILDQTKPEYVVWSAGAGGKGGASRTNAIDRDAAISFIKASISTPSITKFLLVSAISCRRQRASWWDEETWELVQKTNTQVMPGYFQAKLAADEALTVLGEDRRSKTGDKFSYIILRPGALRDGPATGSIILGKTPSGGNVGVRRADVADVAARLLAVEGANGWFDLNGEEGTETGEEIERVLREGVNSMEGESLEEMRKDVK